ncbi:MAG TPA: PhzF family phenazine biosynthesis protein [Steroidobacteraceae bacterium]|nr:PhzF family phenazine biosynthesis protein [Steroidobacteraceae bacterium]
MATLTYRLLNVFTRGAEVLSGNPLCVFEDGSSLDEGTMLALARQFNLSETTFILPSSRASARVRIFTPAFEMPFAGHPTLGTAHVCRALGLGGNELTLEMKAGVIPVSAQTNRWTLQANAPQWREAAEPRETIAAMLGLEARDIGERPLWVSTGREQLIVPLTSEDAVRRVRPNPDALSRLASDGDGNMAYVFAPRAYVFAARTGGSSPSAAGARRELLLARFFFPQGPAVLEDPATGSATANLGGWCIALGRPLPCGFEISQGEQADRPSTLYLDVDADRRVRVSGNVIEIGRGTLAL